MYTVHCTLYTVQCTLYSLLAKVSKGLTGDSINRPILKHDYEVTNKLTGTDRQAERRTDRIDLVLRGRTPYTYISRPELQKIIKCLGTRCLVKMCLVTFLVRKGCISFINML